MTEPHPAHDPHRRADGGQPSWYGGGASGGGSSAASWPDGPAADADRAGWEQAPSYAEQQPAPAYGGDAGHGQDGYAPAGYAPAPGHGRPAYGFGAPLAPGQTEGTGRSVASMILGIVSIVFGIVGIPASCCCWFIGWIFPVAALVAAVVGLTQARGAEDSRHRPLLIAGAVLGGTGLLLVAAAFVAGLLGTIPGLYDAPGDY